MSYNFAIKPVTVDMTAIRKAGATVKQANKAGEKVAAEAKFSSYKIRTVGGVKLSETDIQDVTQLVQKMKENGWLTESDMAWCHTNGIAIN